MVRSFILIFFNLIFLHVVSNLTLWDRQDMFSKKKIRKWNQNIIFYLPDLDGIWKDKCLRFERYFPQFFSPLASIWPGLAGRQYTFTALHRKDVHDGKQVVQFSL